VLKQLHNHLRAVETDRVVEKEQHYLDNTKGGGGASRTPGEAGRELDKAMKGRPSVERALA
jgi:hypothetical protein